MRRLVAAVSALAAGVLAVAPVAAAGVQLTPVQRVSFPERVFVVDLGRDADLARRGVRVWENGAPLRRFSLRPLATTSIHSGVVLAIDASESMTGRPYASAIAGARAFIDARTGAERIGVVAFNDGIHIVQPLTASPTDLHDALGHPPALAHGTRIYDSVDEAVALLRRSGVSTGAVILLSDGADLGSAALLDDAVASARNAHVRIFTVGLVTKSYDAAPLRTLAEETGGSYYEALSAVELTPIYTALGRRLASQYLLGYRSKALPGSAVTLRLSVGGIGSAAADYTAPRREGLAPFHRSFLTRFLLSPAAIVALSLLVAALVGGLLALMLARARSGAVGRIEEFLSSVRAPADQLKTRGREVRAALGSSKRAQGWIAKLDSELEIAGSEMSGRRLALRTAGGTALVSVVLAIVSPVLLLLGFLMPLAVRGWLRRKVRKVRTDFGDQLPANLQVLASALRAGHSFSGALAVMVDNADEPSQRELRRVLADDRLGLPADEAIRHVAERMNNRDLQQVALLSELQRTAGGNAAEVLDTVVETIRERADIRLLLRTLTAQGRMARWILTAIPVVVALFLTLIQPDVMRPLYTTTGGHIALLIAALMVTAGSIVIQRIVDIEV